MTASGQARKPRQQPAADADTPVSGSPPADPAAMPDAERVVPGGSSLAATSAGGGQPADAAGAGLAADPPRAAEEPPANEAELKQQIEQTREQLGKTVEHLAAKADVKGRAGAKATELASRARRTAAAVQMRVATQAGTVRGQLAGKTAAAGEKATAVGGTVKSQLQAKAAPVREAMPEPVRRAGARAASTARQRRAPLVAGAVMVIVGYLVFRWWRQR